MTTEADVDQLIAAWEERLARVDENLILLESEPTYQLLSGRGGQKPSLEGITRERVLPALDALAQLFDHRGRLTEVVERAKEIRSRLGFWDKEQKLLEIRLLLYGPSITMGADPTPLSRRNLLDPPASDFVVVPEQLLFAMSSAFQVARDAVAEVAQAWVRLEPFLASVDRDLGSLKAEAGELVDHEAAPEIDGLERELARMRQKVTTDPLGVLEGVEAALTPRIEELRRRLEDQKATRARVLAGLDDAAAVLRECVKVHASAKDARARAWGEVAHAEVPAAVDDELVAGLGVWREKIDAAAKAGRFGPAAVGLKRWRETGRSFVAQDQAVVWVLDSLLGKRTELVGRLSARRAQLDALSARGAPVDPELTARGRAAEALLSARPTALADAARAVDAYEAEVVSLAARARRG